MIRRSRCGGTSQRSNGLGYALKVGEINIALVTYFFGGRFKALADHIRQDRYAQDIVKNKEAWKYFYFLWKELKLPEPP
jgi:hypothetical protein